MSAPAHDVLASLIAGLLAALETLEFAARHFDPPTFDMLLAAIDGRDAALRRARAEADTLAWPAELREPLAVASDAALQGFDGLRAAPSSEEGVRAAFRALRSLPRALEGLYPVSPVVPAVSRFFLEPSARDDASLVESLGRGEAETGVSHRGGEPGARGGHALYVPENYDAARAHPLVVALHGGSGNGRAFLWTWLREARTRGAILIAPTALGGTWSLQDPERDSANIERLLAQVRGRWNVDGSRMLLTGMSDGGTFALLSGLSDASPFTHLAPVATGFHPMLLEMVEPERLAGLPIYLVHGALDWMFEVGRARGVARALAQARAALTWREIDDLSHSYPREENARILGWLRGTA